MRSWSRWALLLSCVTGVVGALYVFATSPATVPLHYGPSGLPDRWGSRSELLAIYLGILLLGTALFLALPGLLGRLPPSLVNLPNKDYWLRPERRAEAAAKLTVWCNVFGTGLNLLVVAIQAALGWGPAQESRLPLPLIGGFLVFTLAASVWLWRAFRVPGRAE